MELDSLVLNKKITTYESFLNDTLKADLKKVLDQRDDVYKEVAEYLSLKNVIQALNVSKLEDGTLKTKMDLGCNFYCQANVTDPSEIFVAIGCGVHLGMPHGEALSFIEKKTARLNEISRSLTADASKIKAHIRIVLEGLRELQGLSGPERSDHRKIWDA